jgi:hypothetical protein
MKGRIAQLACKMGVNWHSQKAQGTHNSSQDGMLLEMTSGAALCRANIHIHQILGKLFIK